MSNGVPLGMTPDEQNAASEALRQQVDVLARIVRAESELCGLPPGRSDRLVERIIHWLIYGRPMPIGLANEDEIKRMADAIAGPPPELAMFEIPADVHNGWSGL